MSTDADWQKWGEADPYYGVLSTDEFRNENLTDESRATFFRTGSEYIDRILGDVHRHLDADFRIDRCVDFGCGVGRLVIPLAAKANRVTGIDVSDAMLAETAANCAARNIDNVELVKSDDELSALQGKFNFIHSALVLQHIPVKRGMRLFRTLLDHLEPGGVVAVQFHYGCDASPLVRGLVRLRYAVPPVNHARNLLRGRPLREPVMQLNMYGLEDMIEIARRAGISNTYLDLYSDAQFRSVILFGQKS